MKQANRVRFGLVSNEGEGITAHRVDKFELGELADFMIFSYCVHMRKPDPDIWQLALDLAQVKPLQALYIDDRSMFVEVASEIGFTAIQHVSIEETAAQFHRLGFQV
jgi:putative hydrolase of the HAD superfamily